MQREDEKKKENTDKEKEEDRRQGEKTREGNVESMCVCVCSYVVASCVAAGRGSHSRRKRLAGGGALSREEESVRNRHGIVLYISDDLIHRNTYFILNSGMFL